LTGRAVDTIAAIATPPGRGGIGVVRLSGPVAADIGAVLCGPLPPPRQFRFARFRDSNGRVIDEGLVLRFAAPASFTGEDVVELHGHGGPVVMDLLLDRVLELGARAARPGEFSERAFLNDKLDLAQAEAVADLIEADTAVAARLAVRTLDGDFSRRVDSLVEELVQMRMYIEAAIDFPEEEIDFLADQKVSTHLFQLVFDTRALIENAQIGRLLRDGMTLVIAGRPNAGKSSLLNALAEAPTAIVTEVAGTTRDLLRERIQIDGMPLHLVDTAGLRDSDDLIEQEGVRRARAELHRADRVLWVFDGVADPRHLEFEPDQLPDGVPVTFVRNKIDLADSPADRQARITETAQGTEVALSARLGDGLELLRRHLKQSMGYNSPESGEFLARRRHLDALKRALTYIESAERAVTEAKAGELAAEDLRLAQSALGEITGAISSDELLGRIFASFCIGK
jgi:tRNA modification GTPase